MKKSLKCLSVILVMLITLFSFSITALAQTTEQDGLQVSLTTDKQSYSLNENIEITVSVTNTNDFTVENVSIEALLPDNFELKDSKQEMSTKAIDLKAGEQTSLTVVALVKGSNQGTVTEPTTKPTESITENNQNTKPSGQTTTNINSDNNNNSDKSDKNTNSKNNKNGTSPYTGADYTFMGIFLVLFLASVATLFYCLIKHFNKTTKIVSSALCAVIAVTSVIGFSTFKAFADENKSTISVSEQIKVDNEDYTITANVSYIIASIDSITIKDFWESDILVDKINEIEKSYTDENGYVPKNQVQNAINAVSLYASELKDKSKISEYNLEYCDCSNGEPVSVSIIMNSGITVVYTPRQETLSSNTSLSPKINITSVADYQPSLYDFNEEVQEFVRETHKKVYDYLSPYCTLSSCYYENEMVTYSSLSELKSNQLVMWLGHGIRANNHTYLEIGEEYKFTNFLKYDVFNTELKKMLDNKEIIKTANNTIAVNYQYLDKVLGDLSNSMIYLNSCYSGCDQDLCEMFIKKGVSGLVVNSGSINQKYGAIIQIGTISLLSEINENTNNYYTLSEALNYSKVEYGIDDGNGIYPFIYTGDDYRLFPVNGSIIGRVKEQGTNAPISNREVKIYNENYTSDNAMYTFVDKTKTDNNGSFKISLPTGTYTLVIDNDGENSNSNYYYDVVEMKVKVDAGVDTILSNDIILARRENGITGFVYDNDDLINNGKNTPIEDVTVEIYKVNDIGVDYIGKCKTDENGKYTFAVDKNASYDLSFMKLGYEDKTENMVFVSGGFTNRDVYLTKDNSSDDNVKFAGGDGTESNPYQVSTPEQLNAVRNDLFAHYIQINDIDMLNWGNWEPIGNINNPFSGEYNGNKHIINNFTITSTENNTSIGLFGYAPQSTIKNVNMINCSIETSNTIDYVGSIAGFGGILSNCSSSGIINSNCHSGGGISGVANYIENCEFNGELYFYSNTDFNNRKNLDISLINMSGYSVGGYYGGVVGISNKIICSKTKGELSASSKYQAYLGGVVGYSETVIKSYNTANAILYTTGSSSYCPEAYIGGISGVSKEVQNCYNIGNITAKSQNYAGMVGGITGMGYGSYSYCYNIGSLNNNSYYSSWYKGGIIGLSSNVTSNINYCYSNINTLAGSGNVSSKIKNTNSKYLTEVQFRDKSYFTGFDFDDIWGINIDKNNGYPYLIDNV